MEWLAKQGTATAEFAGIKLVSRSQKKVLLLPGNFPDTVWKKKDEMKNKIKNMDTVFLDTLNLSYHKSV